jgi:hypothetical protein
MKRILACLALAGSEQTYLEAPERFCPAVDDFLSGQWPD